MSEGAGPLPERSRGDVDHPRPEHDPGRAEDRGDPAADVLPPIDIIVRLWWDRDPEVFNPGMAPWLAQAALYRAAEYLDDVVDIEEEEDTDG